LRLCGGMGLSKRLSSSTAWKHRRMILDGADMAWMVWPVFDRSLEDYSLVVALALTLRLDAVAAFSTSETASLGSLPHLGVCWVVASWREVTSTVGWRRSLHARHDAWTHSVVYGLAG
jgi:hypothetical protein